MSFQPLDVEDLGNSGPEEVPETKNFAQFQTVDWIQESTPLRRAGERQANEAGNATDAGAPVARWRRYRDLAWRRCQEIITLTCIAVLLGLVAGSIQIVTETLVNWKSGHCARNWLLNKSFCCASVTSTGRGPLSRRDELQCIEGGTWIDRTNPFLDFSLFLLLSVLFATASTLMVQYLAPMATGSGISEIKVWVSGFKYKDEFLNLTTLLVKSTALPLAISSGLSVGKEGPSVHYATCCGFVVTNLLLKRGTRFAEQAEYLIASAAGGVAIAFGAPIGGVLFALEEISTSSNFNLSILWKCYYVALGAVATLQYMDPFRNGKIVMFEVTYDNQWKFQEIPIFLILGAFGGAYGLLISAWNVRFVNFRKTYLQDWRTQEVIFLASITALVSYFNEFLRLDMAESMGILFHECVAGDGESLWTHRICQLDTQTHAGSFLQLLAALLIATVVRSLLIVVSYGCSVPAGIFVPSMAVGATFGRAISLLVEKWITGPAVITPGTYAFLGAAATLSGITNLTLTVVVIMVELTGAFSYIIPLMIAVAVTHLIYSFFSSKGGIADQMIIFNGFPLMENTKQDIDCLEGCSAEDIMTCRVVSVPETLPLFQLKAIVSDADHLKQLLVIDSETHACLGYVNTSILSSELTYAQDSQLPKSTSVNFIESKDWQWENETEAINLCHLVNQSPMSVSARTPLRLLHQIFYKLGCKLAVVESQGSVQGLITKKDFLKFQRLKHRQLHGPLYSFDLKWEQKLWETIKTVFKVTSR
ncbi:Chloride channel protein [Lachancea thermotolerans]